MKVQEFINMGINLNIVIWSKARETAFTSQTVLETKSAHRNTFNRLSHYLIEFISNYLFFSFLSRFRHVANSH